MDKHPQHIAILGAGIVGVWQAYMLASRGHKVTLIEQSREPFQKAASWIAGAMLAPFCETESAEPVIRRLGLRSMELWRAAFPGMEQKGTLVLAPARDIGELKRFARRTVGHEQIDGERLARLEPELAGRFHSALFFAEEAHLQPHWALNHILQLALEAGAEARFDNATLPAAVDRVIDCRGMGAQIELPQLRGVRGEMAILKSPELTLQRPVRLLHPRFAIYVVPWPGHHFMVGATMIESDDRGPVTVRSALELLGSAYALHPAFGEAQIIKLAADLRPAFPDNIPKIIVRGRTLHVNGIYRHGFLTSPALAAMVADYLDGRQVEDGELIVED